MSVDDHGLEVLRKSGAEVVTGDRSEYYILVKTLDDSDMVNVSGSLASPNTIQAAFGIGFTGSYWHNDWYVVSNGGAISLSANPQIQAGSRVGQRLDLIGTSDTDSVQLNHGTGLVLNGPCILKSGSVLMLRWDGTNWVERGRSDIA